MTNPIPTPEQEWLQNGSVDNHSHEAFQNAQEVIDDDSSGDLMDMYSHEMMPLENDRQPESEERFGDPTGQAEAACARVDLLVENGVRNFINLLLTEVVRELRPGGSRPRYEMNTPSLLMRFQDALNGRLTPENLGVSTEQAMTWQKMGLSHDAVEELNQKLRDIPGRPTAVETRREGTFRKIRNVREENYDFICQRFWSEKKKLVGHLRSGEHQLYAEVITCPVVDTMDKQCASTFPLRYMLMTHLMDVHGWEQESAKRVKIRKRKFHQVDDIIGDEENQEEDEDGNEIQHLMLASSGKGNGQPDYNNDNGGTGGGAGIAV